MISFDSENKKSIYTYLYVYKYIPRKSHSFSVCVCVFFFDSLILAKIKYAKTSSRISNKY